MATPTKYKQIMTKAEKKGLLDFDIFDVMYGDKVREWFRDRALEVSRSSPTSIINSNKQRLRTRPIPGEMYLFNYDAKYKDKLPYWDKFPIVLPFETYHNGFIGLNLHYIYPDHRIKLLNALLRNVDHIDSETTRMRISYEMLVNSSRYKWYKPCVKRYLYTHMRSQLFYVPPHEWDLVAMLPLARFNKSMERVHADSAKIISGQKVKW